MQILVNLQKMIITFTRLKLIRSIVHKYSPHSLPIIYYLNDQNMNYELPMITVSLFPELNY
jgi:hypothetical protein